MQIKIAGQQVAVKNAVASEDVQRKLLFALHCHVLSRNLKKTSIIWKTTLLFKENTAHI